MDWQGLLKGELDLTLSIILGLAFGMVILRTGAADKLMKHMMPLLRRFGATANSSFPKEHGNPARCAMRRQSTH